MGDSAGEESERTAATITSEQEVIEVEEVSEEKAMNAIAILLHYAAGSSGLTTLPREYLVMVDFSRNEPSSDQEFGEMGLEWATPAYYDDEDSGED